MRLYFVPIIHIPLPSGGSYNVPKYLPHRLNQAYPGLEGVIYAWETYLLEDIGLAAAETDAAQHAILSGMPDVISVPEILDALMSGSVPIVVAYLESYNTPANWMNASITYRQAARTILNIWQLHNRYVGIVGERLWVEGSNRDLNTKLRDLPVEAQAALEAAAISLGLEWTGKDNDTLRSIMTDIASNLGDVPYKIGDVTI